MTPSVPRSASEPCVTSRFSTSSAVAGVDRRSSSTSGAVEASHAPARSAETLSTPATLGDRVDDRRAEARRLGAGRRRRTGRRWSVAEHVAERRLQRRGEHAHAHDQGEADHQGRRRGRRYAAGCASRSAAPARRAGHAAAAGPRSRAASGRTASGSAMITPTRAAARPRPNTSHRRRRRTARPGCRAAPAAMSGQADDGATLRRRVSAPGVASRSASTGSTLVARRAGTSAATTVTNDADEQRRPRPCAASICSEVLGRLKPTASISALEPLRDADAERRARQRDASTRAASASSSRLRRTWRRVAPIARSSAISRDRWVTIIVKVFQMMNEPTNSAMPAKTAEQDADDLEVRP